MEIIKMDSRLGLSWISADTEDMVMRQDGIDASFVSILFTVYNPTRVADSYKTSTVL